MKRFFISLFSLILCISLIAQSKLPEKGQQLSKLLDGLQVEKKWLAAIEKIDWRTGEITAKTDEKSDPEKDPSSVNGKIPVIDRKIRTHCSAFVAATCEKFGIYILRPPEHSTPLLSNAQYDWLLSHGAEKGWNQLLLPNEAQEMANQGNLVVAVWKNLDPSKPGHIAIVRPGSKNDSQIAIEGPDIIQAGIRNYNNTTLKEGFKNHKGAFDNSEILFFSHEIPAAGEKK